MYNNMVKLTNFQINKLHGIKNYDLKFDDNNLILVGENGTGKTTIIRILYYVLSGQWSALSKFNFESIVIVVNDHKFMIKSSEITQKLDLRKNNIIRFIPAALRSRFHQIIQEFNGGDASLSELEELCIRYDIPFQVILREIEYSNEDLNNKKYRNNNEKLNALKKELKDIQILYLPTYRRIEQELSSIFNGIDENELRHRKRLFHNNRELNYTELIEFGMKDVQRSIESTLNGLKEFARESLNSLTLGYLGDVVDKKYSEVDLAQIKAASTETIKNILERIETKILSNDSKTHLSETIDNVRNDEPLNEHAKVICHYFIKLLNFQQELEIKESRMRSFCAVCNNYMEDKTFEYTSSTFSFLIVPKNRESFDKYIQLDQLSSGEKQIVSLFSHLYLSDENDYFVMIDEPELSLSVTWQRRFLLDIQNVVFCKGIVAVTHSPFIYNNKLESYAHGLGEFLTIGSI